MNGRRGSSPLVTLSVLSLAMLLVTGCQSGGKDGSMDDAAAGGGDKLMVAEPVELLGTRTGDRGDLPHAGIWLIRSHNDLVATGSATLGGLGVDLDAHDMVVVGLGEQKTGGYGVEIAAIQQVGDTLYVQGKASAPAPDAMTTEALTSPWAVAVIANTQATKVQSDIE